jgi:iron(III) transport system ATP-binding protein
MSGIELRDVSKAYQGHLAVRDLCMRVEPGERVALLGPSGCGKTTVLRLVSGLEVPDSGVISVDGRRVAEDQRNLVPPERRHIGMVFQDLALWPHMTVVQHLQFALRYAPLRVADWAARIREVLEMVRLLDRAHARPGELSGGEQQRVALARAIVAKPAIVLMDEPLSSLDAELSAHLRSQILSLHAALGFTLLYVTHSGAEAADLGSRVFNLRQGRLI